MSESEFLALAEQALSAIEAALERVSDNSDVDIECSRTGNVLTVEFIDTASKIIINSQTPMQEIWVAAKSGGFHYRREGEYWLDTRDGSELFAALSKIASEQAQAPIILTANE